jgi:hypothetical protein
MDDASEISDNIATSSHYYGYGGGVYLKDAVFNLNNGKITKNGAGYTSFGKTERGFGGGVYVDTGSTFIKTGGELDDDNIAEDGKVIFVAKPDKTAAATKTTTVASGINLSAVWNLNTWDFDGTNSNWDSIIP